MSPRGEEELAAVLREASANAIPVTIAGGGTGLTGGGVALGGWAVSLEHFNKLEILRGRARAGAGCRLKDLHAAAAASGQFYPPDPTETWAAIGGTIATNASGSRSFRYGDTRRRVLGFRVAFMDGRIVEYRRGEPVDFAFTPLPAPLTTKNTAGYHLRAGMDWVDLFIGSEGTLGVITETELQLLDAPKALLAGVVFFGSDGHALDAVDRWREVPDLRMLEYFDRPSLDLLRNRYSEIPRDAAAALLFEQELASAEDPKIDAWPERLENFSALMDSSWFALSAADRERFREFRHALPEMVNDAVRRNGCLKMGSDFAVPLTRNREMLAFYREHLASAFPAQFVIFGHIGDAHLHVNILPNDGEESVRAASLMMTFARQAVSLGGTVSAEHGLGKRKAHLLALQYTSEQVEEMKRVKRLLDPQWLLGRGTCLSWP